MTYPTLNQILAESVERWGEKPALLYKDPATKEYRPITYRDLGEGVRKVALGLMALGVEKGDRVAIIGENRWEWAVMDWGLLAAGAINASMFATLPPKQVEYILNDSGSKVLAVSTEKQLQKWLAIRHQTPTVEKVVLFDPRPQGFQDEQVLTLEELMALGETYGREHPEAYDQRRFSVQPEDLASLIYTSGTTGEPKGAMLTHANFSSNIDASIQHIDVRPEDIFLSFLPLNHSFERTTGHYLPIRVGATIAYAESLFTIARNLQEVRPTVMMSVPRLYENLKERVLQTMESAPPLKRRIMRWALGVARAVAVRELQERKPVPLFLRLQQALADRLVYRKVRASLGGRLRLSVSGGAALPDDIVLFFHGMNITILQGYGLTETSPVVSCNPSRERMKLGSVGPPIPGVEVKIAEDGEILVRGPNVMKGYWNKPQETAEVLDAEGWLHTGDVGRLDEDGYLYITDRKKEILVLATGKNVAPQPIENLLKSSPYIAEVMLLGDGQKTVTALIVPHFERLEAFARERGIPVEPRSELVRHREVERLIKAEIDRLSENLADFERVRRFRLLDRPFSLEEGELTPTLKLRRKVIMEHYRHLIEEMAD